jgi:hypothetical protein
VTVAGRYFISVTPVENLALELIRIIRCDISCFEYPDDLLSRTTGTLIGEGFCLEPSQYLFRLAIAEDLIDDYRLIVTRTDYPSCD